VEAAKGQAAGEVEQAAISQYAGVGRGQVARQAIIIRDLQPMMICTLIDSRGMVMNA
jgi:hypothetical protein